MMLNINLHKEVRQTTRFLRAIGVMLSVVASNCVHAQVISLDSVLVVIDHNNPMLQEYDKKKEALDAYVGSATSWMAPMVGVGTFMTPYPGQEIVMGDRGSWMVTLEQEIPNPAKLKANKQYFASRSAVEEQNRAVVRNRLHAEAKSAYFKWIIGEQKLTLFRENEAIMELMLKLARLRYPYNQSSLGSIYKAEGRLSEVQNMIEMTRGDIEDNELRLKAMMAIPLETPLMVDTTTRTSINLNEENIDTTSLALQRSDVKQIDRTVNVMRLNQQLQRHQAKPDFRIRFDHMQPVANDMPMQFSAMAMISIPLAPWSSKMYKSEIKGMQLDIEAMQRAREGILLEVQGMLAGMASQLARMQRQLDNYESKIIPSLRKNYQTVMIAYEENREQLPMVIDAWEALNMAQMDFLEKKQEYYDMIVSYEKELEK